MSGRATRLRPCRREGHATPATHAARRRRRLDFPRTLPHRRRGYDRGTRSDDGDAAGLVQALAGRRHAAALLAASRRSRADGPVVRRRGPSRRPCTTGAPPAEELGIPFLPRFRSVLADAPRRGSPPSRGEVQQAREARVLEFRAFADRGDRPRPCDGRSRPWSASFFPAAYSAQRPVSRKCSRWADTLCAKAPVWSI